MNAAPESEPQLLSQGETRRFRVFKRGAEPPRVGECLNCHAEVRTPYCPQCGQKNEPLKMGIWDILQDALEEFLRFDSKLVNTLVPLLTKPGHLTSEWRRGRRTHYISPFKLYLTATFLFFLVASYQIRPSSGTGGKTNLHVAEASDMDGAPEQVQFVFRTMQKLNTTDKATVLNGLIENMPKALFLMLPLFAVGLSIVYVRSARFYAEHLVFALHNHAFYFICMTLVEWTSGQVFRGIAFLVMVVYSVLSLKRYYNQGWIKTLVKANLLGVSYMCLLGTAMLFAVFLSAMALPDPSKPNQAKSATATKASPSTKTSR